MRRFSLAISEIISRRHNVSVGRRIRMRRLPSWRGAASVARKRMARDISVAAILPVSHECPRQWPTFDAGHFSTMSAFSPTMRRRVYLSMLACIMARLPGDAPGLTLSAAGISAARSASAVAVECCQRHLFIMRSATRYDEVRRILTTSRRRFFLFS